MNLKAHKKKIRNINNVNVPVSLPIAWKRLILDAGYGMSEYVQKLIKPRLKTLKRRAEFLKQN